MSIVKNNLLIRPGYSPYCGDDICLPRTSFSLERWPRTKFNGKQFICPKCNWTSEFPEEFIKEYKSKWNIEQNLTKLKHTCYENK